MKRMSIQPVFVEELQRVVNKEGSDSIWGLALSLYDRIIEGWSDLGYKDTNQDYRDFLIALEYMKSKYPTL